MVALCSLELLNKPLFLIGRIKAKIEQRAAPTSITGSQRAELASSHRNGHRTTSHNNTRTPRGSQYANDVATTTIPIDANLSFAAGFEAGSSLEDTPVGEQPSMLSIVSSVGGGTFGGSTSLEINDNAIKGGASSKSQGGVGNVKGTPKAGTGGRGERGATETDSTSGNDGGSTPLSLLATTLEGQKKKSQSQQKTRLSSKESTVSTGRSFMHSSSAVFYEKPLVVDPYKGISVRPHPQLDGGSVG